MDIMGMILSRAYLHCVSDLSCDTETVSGALVIYRMRAESGEECLTARIQSHPIFVMPRVRGSVCQ